MPRAELAEKIENLPVRSKVSIYDVALNKARNSRSYYSFDEATSKEALNQLYRYKVEWHKKMSLPVSIMIFFLIGAPLGAIIRKGGLGMPVVVSVGFFVIYYIITITRRKDGAGRFVGLVSGHVDRNVHSASDLGIPDL